MKEYSNEPALDALIEYLAEKNAAVYVKRTVHGKRYLHFTKTLFVSGKPRTVTTIVTDATGETGDPKSLRVYQPENKEKNVLSTVQRFISFNTKGLPTLEE